MRKSSSLCTVKHGNMEVAAVTAIVGEVNAIVNTAEAIRKLVDQYYQARSAWEDFPRQVKSLQTKSEEWKKLVTEHELGRNVEPSNSLQEAHHQLEKVLQELHEREEQRRKGKNEALPKIHNALYPSLIGESINKAINKAIKAFDDVPKSLDDQYNFQLAAQNAVRYDERKLSFSKHDDRYVRLEKTEQLVEKALLDQWGKEVTLLHGGPGKGKSTLARYFAGCIEASRVRVDGQTSQPDHPHPPVDGRSTRASKGINDAVKSSPVQLSATFDKVVFLRCDESNSTGAIVQRATKDVKNELQEILVGWSSQVGGNATSALQTTLWGFLRKRKVLIVFDNVWDDEFLESMILYGLPNVKYLVTSQDEDVCFFLSANVIHMETPSLEDARTMFARHIRRSKDGQTHDTIPHQVQHLADQLIEKVDRNPLAIACLATGIDPGKIRDVEEWEKVQRDYSEHLGAAKKAMMFDVEYPGNFWDGLRFSVERLHKKAKLLLFLIGLSEEPSVPQEVLEYFYGKIMRKMGGLPWGRQAFITVKSYLEAKDLVRVGRDGRCSIKDMLREFVKSNGHKANQKFKKLVLTELSSINAVSESTDPYSKDVFRSTVISLYFKGRIPMGFETRQRKREALEPLTRLLTQNEEDGGSDWYELIKKMFVRYAKGEYSLHLLKEDKLSLECIKEDLRMWEAFYDFVERMRELESDIDKQRQLESILEKPRQHLKQLESDIDKHRQHDKQLMSNIEKEREHNRSTSPPKKQKDDWEKPNPHKGEATHQGNEGKGGQEKPNPHKGETTHQGKEGKGQQKPNPHKGETTHQGKEGKGGQEKPKAHEGETTHQGKEGKGDQEKPNPHKGETTHQGREGKGGQEKPNPHKRETTHQGKEGKGGQEKPNPHKGETTHQGKEGKGGQEKPKAHEGETTHQGKEGKGDQEKPNPHKGETTHQGREGKGGQEKPNPHKRETTHQGKEGKGGQEKPNPHKGETTHQGKEGKGGQEKPNPHKGETTHQGKEGKGGQEKPNAHKGETTHQGKEGKGDQEKPNPHKEEIACLATRIDPEKICDVKEWEDIGEDRHGVCQSLPSTSVQEVQLRADVQSLGFLSWDQKFNPGQILVLCDITCEKMVHFICFHEEGMLRLLGIGILYSKISIHLEEEEVVVEEMTKDLWKTYWVSSYDGSFKPLLLEKTELEKKEVSQNLEKNIFLFTKDEALLKMGISMEGPQFQEFVKISKSTPHDKEDKVKSTSDSLLLGLAKEIFGFLSRQLGFHQPISHSVDQISGGTKAAMSDKIDQLGQKRSLAVVVKFCDLEDCIFYNIGEEGKLNKVEDGSDLLRLPKDISSIRPELRIEFFHQREGNRDINCMVTTLMGVYQMCCQNVDWPAGWDQDDLRLSFKCSEDGNWQSSLGDTEIKSKWKFEEKELMQQSGGSSDRKHGINSEVGLQLSLLGFTLSRAARTSQINESNQVNYKANGRCLLVDSPSFDIADHSSCAKRMIEFKATCLDPTTESRSRSSVKMEIKGNWTLHNKGTHAYEFAVKKRLTLRKQCSPMSSWLEGPSVWDGGDRNVAETHKIQEKIWQIFSRSFLVNHNFREFFEARKKDSDYQWTLLDRSNQENPLPEALNVSS